MIRNIIYQVLQGLAFIHKHGKFITLCSWTYMPCECSHAYGLLTKCEGKMAGYWPSSFFACLWTETKSRSKKRTRAISSHLDRTNLVNKGFILWLQRKFCLWETAGSPEQARWLHLDRSGSQSQRAIWFILPACGARHIINQVIGRSGKDLLI